ncbi:MAG TPA: oligosaccharide flippase family protein [Flavitalea sp.]|nr:oligosaccharide flippase family protein [Flavitalea sp.]
MKILRAWVEKYKQSILLNRLFAVLSIDILVKLSGVILLPVYLRIMTQDEYGLYNYLLSIVLTFSLVLTFGLYIPISKFYHDYADKIKKGKLLFTTFILLLGGLTMLIAIVYSAGLDVRIIKILFRHELNYQNYRLAILLAVVTSVFSFMLTSFLFTSEKIKQVKRYNISRIVWIHLASIALLYFMPETNAAELRLQITYALEFVLLLIFSVYVVREMHFQFDYKLAIASIKMGLPIMLSALFGIVINFSDKFFLEKYGTLTDLSNYYLAIAFASIIPTIFASVQNAWIPLFMKEKNIGENVKKTNKLIRNLTLVFIGISLMIWVFLEILLVMSVIPKKYNEVTFVLPILLLTQIAAALSALYNNYLVYFERTHLISITGLIICIISIVASIFMIPRWGIYGAAAATMLSNILYLLTYNLLSKRIIARRI